MTPTGQIGMLMTETELGLLMTEKEQPLSIAVVDVAEALEMTVGFFFHVFVMFF
jgi:hypothetical protein